jgi:outer membrane lipoprotein-sorting protein
MIFLAASSFALAIFLGIVGDGLAQNKTDVPSEVISRIDLPGKNLKDFQARVRQTKFFGDLGEEVTFLGTVAYARPRQMLWEFTSPDPSSLLIRADGIWLIVPGTKQVQKVGSRGGGIMERIDSYFLGFEKSPSEMKGHGYQIERLGNEALEQGPAELVKLTRPNDPFAAEIWLWFDASRGIPLRIRWKGAQNDTTTTDFFDVKVNEGVNPNLFDLRIPEGYTTIITEDSPA